MLVKVKIGNLEITVESLEELDQIVKRYGNVASEDSAGQAHPDKKTKAGQSATVGSGAADTVLLKKFVEAGDSGVTTIEVGTILGRRGKAARPALREWAKRIGLTTDGNLEPFDEARVGTKRGLRIKSSLQQVAEHILKQK